MTKFSSVKYGRTSAARLEFFVGGGALLDIELQRFFYAIGIPMFQGYGLSESSPVISANVPKKHKLGSSGSIVPNLEVKICDEKGNALPVGEQGEIVVKGENVMAGYWKNERATGKPSATAGSIPAISDILTAMGSCLFSAGTKAC